MIFTETPLKGAYVINIEKHVDERGFFARAWCKNEFKKKGLSTNLAQFSISFNKNKGTLRGMHLQISPNEEIKIVRCTTGSLYDVIIDLRKESPTYLSYFGIELTAENRTMLYVPKGFAHGFITLNDNTEIFYLISEFYVPQSARSFIWNDPSFGIKWPITPTTISDKDKNNPLFYESALVQ